MATKTPIDDSVPNFDETDLPENARRMMRAAIQLFARKGFAGTSVREIVQAAEVTNPMLYYYFDDKEGLFNTLITFLFEYVTSDVLASLESASSLVEAVEGIILAYFEACKDSPVATRFVYSVLFGPEESAPKFDVIDAREQMVAQVAQLIDEATERGKFQPHDQFDSKFLTEQLLSLLNSYLMRTMKEVETYSDRAVRHQRIKEMLTPEMAHDLRQFFFKGAGTLTD